MKNILRKQLKKNKLLERDELAKQNKLIEKLLLKNGINLAVSFEAQALQKHIDEQKSFSSGLVSYLTHLKLTLEEAIPENDPLRLEIFQRFSELGSAVFPNTNACYSIIPKDLKNALSEEEKCEIHDKIINNHPELIEIRSLTTLFRNEEQTLICIVALCLCEVYMHSLNKINVLLVKKTDGALADDSEIERPQIKGVIWLSRLSYAIERHLYGLSPIDKLTDAEKAANITYSKTPLTPSEKEKITLYAKQLAQRITEHFTEKMLLRASDTITDDSDYLESFKNPKYYSWVGSNLLVLPQTLTLPMVCEPIDWQIDTSKKTSEGGYFLSTFTNLSYQGYLDNKSHRTHQHHIQIRDISTINTLQKVGFVINAHMLNFYLKHSEKLTDNNKFFISEKWLNVSADLEQTVQAKHEKLYATKELAVAATRKELITNRNETLRTKETLKIAQLYCNQKIYWPAYQDFRGRIYRIGHLNMQLDPFVRSLIAFHSDKRPISNRKKNKSTFEKFNMLLKAILVENGLITKWDLVFSDRFIFNDEFENLLLEGLLVDELSSIQVGQLLLLRHGAYDQIGTYYDASASAYQIMGCVTGDKELCRLTNVLGSSTNTKQDIYGYFLPSLSDSRITAGLEKLPPRTKDRAYGFQINKYTREQNELLKKTYLDCLHKHFDRSLAKALIMPLTYGKTAEGFSKDLKAFFKTKNYYPNIKFLCRVANKIINTLKAHPSLEKANSFMKLTRALASFLYDIDDITIRGPFIISHIQYHKETTERLSLYVPFEDALTGRRRYKRQQVTFKTVAKDSTTGTPIKSRIKSVNSFVANYIHYLDGVVCHSVIESLSKKRGVPLGTIHDCFYIKPENAELLNRQYKKGLVLAMNVHQYNTLIWLIKLMGNCGMATDETLSAYIDTLSRQTQDFSYLQKDESSLIISNLIKAHHQFAILTESQKSPILRAKMEGLVDYLKESGIEGINEVKSLILSDSCQSLFPDNK